MVNKQHLHIYSHPPLVVHNCSFIGFVFKSLNNISLLLPHVKFALFAWLRLCWRHFRQVTTSCYHPLNHSDRWLGLTSPTDEMLPEVEEWWQEWEALRCQTSCLQILSCCFLLFSCDQAALQMVFSVCLSVCPSVRLSVCHTFLTMFPSSYHHEIFRSYYQWLK